MWYSFWHGDGNWRGYKATSILLTSGIGTALLDNYWIFTSVPFAENDNSPTGKAFYLIAQILLNSMVFGAGGLALDYLRSIYHRDMSERSTLLNL